jgi:hypothetical protein
MKNTILTLSMMLSAIWAIGQSENHTAPLQSFEIDPVDFTLRNLVDVQPRTPLYEMFTSSTCGPCYYGNVDLKEAFNGSNGNWTCVKYQMYWPGNGDPYFTDEGYARGRYYDVFSVPMLQVDGNIDISLSGLNQQVMKDFEEVPSKVNIEAHYMQDERNFEVEVTLEPTQNILTPFLKLFVAIVENKTYNNVETNGETEFEYVMKKMLPDHNGTQVKPLKMGEPQDFSFSYEFKGDYRLPNDSNDPIDHEIEHSVEEFDDLSIVVWVQNRNTTEILQSTWATMPTGIEEIVDDQNSIISVFPNPVEDHVNIHYLIKKSAECRMELIDLSGKTVQSKDLGFKPFGHYHDLLDVSNFTPGNYYLQFISGDQKVIQQILKIK